MYSYSLLATCTILDISMLEKRQNHVYLCIRNFVIDCLVSSYVAN